MKHKKKYIVLCLMMCLIISGTLTACGGKDGSGTKVLFTTGLGKEDVFRIENEVCTLPELKLYLTTTQNQYEQVYGEEIWQAGQDGVKLGDNIKETVLAEIAQIKSLYLLALDKNIEVAAKEEECIQQAAEAYYGSLNAAELEALAITQEEVAQLYREYLLANKVYNHIIADVNPEISDDEARRITLQHIWLKDYLLDGEGDPIPLSDKERNELLQDAREIREMAVNGEQDFEQLASKYSDSENITVTFGKGEMSQVIEDAAFLLATDEISQVIEAEDGFHILKCLSTLDREETDLNKLKIVEQRRNEAFGKEYDTFVKGLARKLNRKLWNQITLIENPQVTTSDFFEVYKAYLGTETD